MGKRLGQVDQLSHLCKRTTFWSKVASKWGHPLPQASSSITVLTWRKQTRCADSLKGTPKALLAWHHPETQPLRQELMSPWAKMFSKSTETLSSRISSSLWWWTVTVWGWIRRKTVAQIVIKIVRLSVASMCEDWVTRQQEQEQWLWIRVCWVVNKCYSVLIKLLEVAIVERPKIILSSTTRPWFSIRGKNRDRKRLFRIKLCSSLKTIQEGSRYRPSLDIPRDIKRKLGLPRLTTNLACQGQTVWWLRNNLVK